MDKETLSNYGWIVICVLVLAVMIALATPFGGYISTAVKSTTQGLFDTNKNALNSTRLINIGDQSFDDGNSYKTENITFYYDNGDYLYLRKTISGNELGAQTIEDGKKFVKDIFIPTLAKCSFDDYLRNTGATEDELWTELKLTDETFEPAVLQNGWFVRPKSTEQTEYAPILESINGIPITDMSDSFQGCSNMTKAPKIPETVTDMNATFMYCTSLSEVPNIPQNVQYMPYTFKGCTLLKDKTISIPTSVTNPNGTSGSWEDNGPSWIKR